MTPTAETRDTNRRALSILARSLFRQMREQGYSPGADHRPVLRAHRARQP